MHDRDDAKLELKALEDLPRSPEKQTYLSKVQSLFSAMDQTAEAKRKIIEAISKYQVEGINRVLDRLSLSPSQRAVLAAYLNVYQGDFANASKAIADSSVTTYSEREQLEDVSGHINALNKTYSESLGKIDKYLHGPLTASVCFQGDYLRYEPAFSSISIQEYLNLIRDISSIAPLNHDVMDLVFHAQMLTGDYDALEKLGDMLLDAKGTVRIPFFASDRFFNLVIDSKQKRLFTEPDSHPFPRQKYTMGFGAWKEAERTPSFKELEAFNLAFSDIREISQNASGGNPVGTLKGSYALKVEPNGLAPNYALMQLLECSAGYPAEFAATRALGLYVKHVIGNDQLKAKLADPAKARSSTESGWTSALVALYGAMETRQGHPELASMVNQALAEQREADAKNAETEQQTMKMLQKDFLEFTEREDFKQIETLLGVVD
jgi:hypothetical protein